MSTSFDDIVRHVGDFGRYQKQVLLLICLVSLHDGPIVLGTVFTSYIPKHRCRLPDWEGDTYAIQNPNHSAAIHDTIHVEVDNTSDTSVVMSQCFLYTDNGTLAKCSEWVYDNSVFTSTIVSQVKHLALKLEIVEAAGDAGIDVMTNLANEMYDTGEIPKELSKSLFISLPEISGAVECKLHIIISLMSHVFKLTLNVTINRIGRRKCTLLTLVIATTAQSLSAISPNIFVFAMFHFLAGIGVSACYLVMFGLGIEMVGKSKRFHAGIIVNYFYALSVMLLSVYGYILRDWRHLQLISGLSGILFVSYYWLLPESPRWLINQNRKPEAVKIIRCMAKVNKVKLDEQSIDKLNVDESRVKKTVKLCQVLKYRSVLSVFAIIIFNWIVAALLYFGLSLNSGDLFGSVHLNVFLSGVMEIIAYLLVHVLINRIGRRLLYVTAAMIGGSACLLTIFPVLYLSAEHQWLTVALAMIGKLCAAGIFSVIYLQTSEIYPTGIRVSGVGLSSMTGRLGSIVSPYIADMALMMPGDIGRAMPLIIFGGAVIISGLLSLKLPETLNKPLPETLDDCITLIRGRGYSRAHIQETVESIPLDMEPIL